MKKLITLFVLSSALFSLNAGAAAPSTTDASILDPCTIAAINAAGDAWNQNEGNYLHVYGFSVDSNPSSEGENTYTVTIGNDEDGTRDFIVVMNATTDQTSGKTACKVKGEVKEVESK